LSALLFINALALLFSTCESVGAADSYPFKSFFELHLLEIKEGIPKITRIYVAKYYGFIRCVLVKIEFSPELTDYQKVYIQYMVQAQLSPLCYVQYVQPNYIVTLPEEPPPPWPGFVIGDVLVGFMEATTATLDFQPKALCIGGYCEETIAVVQLAAGHDVRDIDPSSIILAYTAFLYPIGSPVIGDYNNDTIPDLKMDFNRTALIELIRFDAIKTGNMTLNMVGKLSTGGAFEANYTMRVKAQGDVNVDGEVDIADIWLVASLFGSDTQSPEWNPLADQNEDQTIDITDLYLVAVNFGKTYF
jgi:hypothetical protein